MTRSHYASSVLKKSCVCHDQLLYKINIKFCWTDFQQILWSNTVFRTFKGMKVLQTHSNPVQPVSVLSGLPSEMSDRSLDCEADILLWLQMRHVVNCFYLSVLIFTQNVFPLLSETITYLYNPVKSKLLWSRDFAQGMALKIS